MNTIDLHIVSFDVPLPANYGGAIDVLNRIIALHKKGISVALHCFEYGRGKHDDLEKYCSVVYYYPRRMGLLNHLSKTPFIVLSRKNTALLKNLCKDNAPILFEGHHSCFFLGDKRLEKRKKWVRIHNIEPHYYQALARATSNLLKKIYYGYEAKKLAGFEKQLRHAQAVLPLSTAEVEYYRKINENTVLLRPFHSFQLAKNNETVDNYAIYHGNLAVEENVLAAKFLIDVFAALDFRLVIAGRRPNKVLKQLSSVHGNIELIADPSEPALQNLIKNAKLNCLYTEQSTGVKLKLLRALLEGNIVLVNQNMLIGTSLDEYCYVADDATDWRKQIQQLMQLKLDSEELNKRKTKVADLFNNDQNIATLCNWIKA